AAGLGWLGSPAWMRKFYQAGQGYELGFETQPASGFRLRLNGEYQMLPIVTTSTYTVVTSVPGLNSEPTRDTLQLRTTGQGWIGSGPLGGPGRLPPHLGGGAVGRRREPEPGRLPGDRVAPHPRGQRVRDAGPRLPGLVQLAVAHDTRRHLRVRLPRASARHRGALERSPPRAGAPAGPHGRLVDPDRLERLLGARRRHTPAAQRVFSRISRPMRSRKPASGMAPRSPSPLRRTLTVPASASRGPTTSMYGIFASSASRILAPSFSSRRSMSARMFATFSAATVAFA